MSDAENMFQPTQAAQKGPMVRLRSWFLQAFWLQHLFF